MRPYLAVIKDSFRAATSSWVLYIMLALITLVLVLVLPFGIKEQQTTIVTERDIEDLEMLTNHLVTDGRSETNSPAKHIWQKLPETVQKDLVEYVEPKKSTSDDQPTDDELQHIIMTAQVQENIIESFNDLIEEDDLYDSQAWQNVRLRGELKELANLEASERTDLQRQRMNRLLISRAFVDEIGEGNPTSLRFRYLVWDIFSLLAMKKQEVVQMINLTIPWFLDKFVLSVGIFIAILVTAPMIPQTFEAGALSLLLSKPVNRWTVFLSKFVGGCAFTFLCALYLFVGLWFILGIRLGIWNNALLICIPIYVFVFAIYYSVSVLAGVVYRNTIVAVVFSILFWFLCWSVGTVKGICQSMIDKFEIQQIVLADDEVVQVDSVNSTYVWDNNKNGWQMALVPEEQQQIAHIMHFNIDPVGRKDLLGPVYDEPNASLIASQSSLFYGGNPLSTAKSLVFATQANEWEPIGTAPLPQYSLKLLIEPTTGQAIIVSRSGTVYRLTGQPQEDDTSSGETDTSTDESDVEVFTAVGPEAPVSLSRKATATINRTTGEIALFSRGELILLEKNDQDQYQLKEGGRTKLTDDSRRTALLAFQGEWLLVAMSNGEIVLLDRRTLQSEQTYSPEKVAAVKSVDGSPNGRWFSVVFDNGRLWLLDTESPSKMFKARVTGQGDVPAAAFSEENQLWVADRTNRMSLYTLESMKVEKRLSPKLNFFESIFRYGISPAYTICPKPGEFYNLVTHLSNQLTKDKDTERSVSSGESPWPPFWNGLAFLTVMLVIACIYIERQDF